MEWIGDKLLMEISKALGWTIIHSLWQGAILACLFIILILIFRRYGIRIKYFISMSVLGLFLLCSSITFVHLYPKSNTSVSLDSFQIENNFQNHISDQNADEKHDVYAVQNQHNFWQKITYSIKEASNYLDKKIFVVSIIWILGFTIIIMKVFRGAFLSHTFRKNRLNRTSGKWQKWMNGACIDLGIKRKVKVLFSPLANTPFVFGFFKPIILFPVKLITGLSEKEIEVILVHELAHIRRNDYLAMFFQTIIESFFFYHPAVWWISKKINIQREIICDEICLDYTSQPKLYVNTLIKLSEQSLLKPELVLAAGGKRNELLQRIKWIISRQNNQRRETIQRPIMVFSTIVILFLIFMVSGFSFKEKKTDSITGKTFSLDKYFNPFEGSFVLYDVQNNNYFQYNDSLSLVQYSPYSTFKIVSSLIAIESGLAKDENYTIEYDSLKYPSKPWRHNTKPFKYWFQNQTLHSALKYSVNWFYHELNHQIGSETLNLYVDRIQYGNHDISSGIDNFWLGGSLKISAIEQLDFFKSLYGEKLVGISEKSQKMVKKMILNESTNHYKLYGKTGTGECPNDKIIGWYVGFLEIGSDAYIFALNMLVNDYSDLNNNKRLELTKEIFRELNILKR